MYSVATISPGTYPVQPADALTLGIEVTDPTAALRCGLGVIDPQHGPGAKADAPAAIEVCLDAALPPRGARLVTIRPDLDSVGSMAILQLRAAGVSMDDDLRHRARRIAALDRFDRGRWPGPRPAPANIDDILNGGPERDLVALAAAVSDNTTSLPDRVVLAERWLQTGEAPGHQAEAARQRAEALLRSLRVGATLLQTEAQDRIAVVISLEQGVLDLAYRLAPVVVALHPAFQFRSGQLGRKYTVAAWSDGLANLNAVADQLGQQEPGWGGQRRIKGSPQDRASKLDLSTVIVAVEQYLHFATMKEAI